MNIDKDFYCENRQDEAMLPCGEQCSTCKSMNHPNIEVSWITPEEIVKNIKKQLAKDRIQDWNDSDTIYAMKLYADLQYNAAIQKAIDGISILDIYKSMEVILPEWAKEFFKAQSLAYDNAIEELEKLKK